MATIEAGRPVAPSQAAASEGDVATAFEAAASAFPSLPDPQVLTRLANEMFSAWPGAGPIASAVSPAATEVVAAPAKSLGVVVPSSDTVAYTARTHLAHRSPGRRFP